MPEHSVARPINAPTFFNPMTSCYNAFPFHDVSSLALSLSQPPHREESFSDKPQVFGSK